jgi:hypothetical protein
MFHNGINPDKVPITTQEDVDIYKYLLDSMDRVPYVKPNLISISSAVKDLIGQDIRVGEGADGLSDLFDGNQLRHESIDISMMRVFIAAMKQRYTRTGKKGFAFKEEYDAMVMAENFITMQEVDRIVNVAGKK